MIFLSRSSERIFDSSRYTGKQNNIFRRYIFRPINIDLWRQQIVGIVTSIGHNDKSIGVTDLA